MRVATGGGRGPYGRTESPCRRPWAWGQAFPKTGTHPRLRGRAIAYDKTSALFAIPPYAHRRRTFPGRSAARSPCGVLRCRPGIVPGSESGLSRFWRGHDVERSRISGAPLRKSCALHRVREKHNGLDPHQAKKSYATAPAFACGGRGRRFRDHALRSASALLSRT